MLFGSWTFGLSFGFEFLDSHFAKYAWILHLGCFKLIYISTRHVK